jgi:Predicted membrane protein (DUF2157)
MTLNQWRDKGVITPEQYTLLDALSRREPFSVFIELNILLYAGVVALVGGLAWTAETFSRQLGDVLVIAVLFAILAACLWYCFSRARPWSAAETPPPNLIFDYVLYFGALTWSAELSYLESRFHLLSGQWDTYLLATAGFLFILAYRFDNRFVLSMALAALAGWFGLKTSHWPGSDEGSYRTIAILYGVVTGLAGIALKRLAIKAHFFPTFLNLAANVLFVAVLSGVFNRTGYLPWFLLLIAACGASLAYGLTRKQFSFVAYATVYGYIGLSSVLMRDVNNTNGILSYFVVTGIAMLILLFGMARRFGRET